VYKYKAKAKALFWRTILRDLVCQNHKASKVGSQLNSGNVEAMRNQKDTPDSVVGYVLVIERMRHVCPLPHICSAASYMHCSAASRALRIAMLVESTPPSALDTVPCVLGVDAKT
jgi:hypothetical protein